MDIDGETSRTMEESSRSMAPKDSFSAQPEEGNCPGCGCVLSPYEIFACRIRGLERPVCVGCLASALVSLRDRVYPLVEGLLRLLVEEYANMPGRVRMWKPMAPSERIKRAARKLRRRHGDLRGA